MNFVFQALFKSINPQKRKLNACRYFESYYLILLYMYIKKKKLRLNLVKTKTI